ncbi:MAG: dTMP kinase [Oscillospiraceae bacterium]|nr:dTMP kinase [Oscillospiraceae bacterium]
MKKGKFIVFEGIDGSGKTTQAEILCERLKKCGISAETTREPTDGEIGKLIRRALTREITFSEQTMSMLFAADRTEHILGTDGILEKVNSGISVVSDRYYFSSYAYNSVGVPLERVVELNGLNRELMQPDITVFIDVSVDEAMRRISKSRAGTELYEKKERLTIVRENFFDVFKRMGENVAIIPANSDIDKVAECVWESVRGILGDTL